MSSSKTVDEVCQLWALLVPFMILSFLLGDYGTVALFILLPAVAVATLASRAKN